MIADADADADVDADASCPGAPSLPPGSSLLARLVTTYLLVTGSSYTFGTGR